ncbi:MAG: peptidylprolyl isomerase [Kiritimatiellae bacterium]|nr:peptidylprolyl isomerase [Kiritimatiellia bacterium]
MRILSTMVALAVMVSKTTWAETTDSPSGTAPSAGGQPHPPEQSQKPVVVIKTSLGTIKAELWPDKAKETVANFLRYVDEKFYDGLVFHRVIDGFMIQGGGFNAKLEPKPTHPPIKNEARADVPNARGTLAMARTAVVDSATSQFFINLVDNGFLNHRDETPTGFGYCVFGRVIEGMDVVDRIGKVKTGSVRHFNDVPLEPVIIESIRRQQ